MYVSDISVYSVEDIVIFMILLLLLSIYCVNMGVLFFIISEYSWYVSDSFV